MESSEARYCAKGLCLIREKNATSSIQKLAWHSQQSLVILLLDIKHLSEFQPQTRLLGDHDKVRQSKATSQPRPSADKSKVAVPP